ncbi:nitrite/sulfite reductase [Euzebya tangerina]|uniref:nitrite/sulfite reductase n=1 Tax=Euzebya tangerina TaxID=591198 RepID=UPI000E317A31|nr:nitrite/sulfite reductase [Euzebya tangerina]
MTTTAPTVQSQADRSYADMAEIDEFEQTIAAWKAGTIDDDEFRTRRLHMGTYGIRNSEDHMIRIKIPGGLIEPDHLDAIADVADEYSRGFAHLTTRQNFQLHFVKTDEVPGMLRRLAESGLTTREGCGNSVRTITQSHLAGIDPDEVVDTRNAAEVVTRYFLRHPLTQALPRKFKMAFDGSTRDHAQLGIHDIGFLGVVKDGQAGFKLYVGGGLGSAPREADLLEPFTPVDRVLPTVEAILTVFEEHGERKNRVRARMKFLLNKWGIERFRAEVETHRIRLERETIYPHIEAPIRPAARRADGEAITTIPLPGAGPTLAAGVLPAYEAWRDANVFGYDVEDEPGEVAYGAYATFHLGDLTSGQMRDLARVWRRIGDHVSVRTTIRQNLLFVGLQAEDVPVLFAALHDGNMALARAERSGDIVSCPGAETCNLAVTASRGLAGAVTDALEAGGLHEIEDLRINISGCPNSCGQHTTADLGFSGMARRDPNGNEAPGYRVFVGARIGDGGAKFGHYVAKVPAKKAPDVAVTLLERYATERQRGEQFADWVARVGPKTLKADLKVHDSMPALEEDPDFYTDWGNSERFAVQLGESECA